MTEVNETRKALETTLGEVMEERGRFGPEEVSLIEIFADRLKSEVFNELERLEEEIKTKGSSSSNPKFRMGFRKIFNSFHAIAVSSPGLRGVLALKRLNEVWGHGMEAMTGFLERNSKEVGVESWSVGATIGFPSGVSGSISINFR